MKVNNNKDSVDLSQIARSKRGDKVAKNKAAETGEAGAGAGAASTANVEISSEAKTMSAANQIAKAEATDQEKIDRIKAMIQSGTYKPDFGKVADKMINENLLQDLS
jgi:flagellar biosynthesis anti-sigma factor FlgM